MIANTATSYGAVTKTFHWLTLLLMLTAIPLAIYAHDLPNSTGEELAFKARIYSLHKTVGVTLFFVALLRILWAVTQPKPMPLSNRPAEHWLAETIHWVLYAAIVLVPLTGWIHHAASEGFAPILWPLGQTLPFVPKDEDVSKIFATLHWLFKNLLIGAILLHVAGALKHHFIDRDQTLNRMLPGHTEPQRVTASRHAATPIFAAALAYIAVVGTGLAAGLFEPAETTAPAQALEEAASEWQVQDGTLAITVKQLGSDVTGQFEDWTAAIEFDPEATDGKHGQVEVTINIGSLVIGSVTDQALGGDFFAAETHPTAVFAADILSEDDGYVADGTLTLKGIDAPVSFPFDLTLDGDTAQMSGQTSLERLTYDIGETYPDESSVGFDVVVDIALTAMR